MKPIETFYPNLELFLPAILDRAVTVATKSIISETHAVKIEQRLIELSMHEISPGVLDHIRKCCDDASDDGVVVSDSPELFIFVFRREVIKLVNMLYHFIYREQTLVDYDICVARTILSICNTLSYLDEEITIESSSLYDIDLSLRIGMDEEAWLSAAILHVSLNSEVREINGMVDKLNGLFKENDNTLSKLLKKTNDDNDDNNDDDDDDVDN